MHGDVATVGTTTEGVATNKGACSVQNLLVHFCKP